jgi:hypothetical protein
MLAPNIMHFIPNVNQLRLVVDTVSLSTGGKNQQNRCEEEINRRKEKISS